MCGCGVVWRQSHYQSGGTKVGAAEIGRLAGNRVFLVCQNAKLPFENSQEVIANCHAHNARQNIIQYFWLI